MTYLEDLLTQNARMRVGTALGVDTGKPAMTRACLKEQFATTRTGSVKIDKGPTHNSNMMLEFIMF